MKTETKILIAVLLISTILVIGAILLLGKSDQTKKNVNEEPTLNIDYSRGEKIGSDSAKVKLVEFSDLQCPACKIAEPAIKQVIDKNQGKLQFIYRHFPLMQHIHSRKAANFAEYAASQGKFWEIHDKLFETQEEWDKLADPTDYFVSLGSQFGLDKAKAQEAISKKLYEDKINADVAEANRLGVDATPTFYLNGRKLQLQSFTDLESIVSQELQK
ncbi:thioredoxin domain-containing protein [Candidatus Daviesbacteria bacterium]|nr:thioredoxin domain-containing protein [Candidatus Daviesbacteria bacterium]